MNRLALLATLCVSLLPAASRAQVSPNWEHARWSRLVDPAGLPLEYLRSTRIAATPAWEGLVDMGGGDRVGHCLSRAVERRGNYRALFLIHFRIAGRRISDVRVVALGDPATERCIRRVVSRARPLPVPERPVQASVGYQFASRYSDEGLRNLALHRRHGDRSASLTARRATPEEIASVPLELRAIAVGGASQPGLADWLRRQRPALAGCWAQVLFPLNVRAATFAISIDADESGHPWVRAAEDPEGAVLAACFERAVARRPWSPGESVRFEAHVEMPVTTGSALEGLLRGAIQLDLDD